MPRNTKLEIAIRDITKDDIESVDHFIRKEQGEAEQECEECYIQALIREGDIKVEGKLSYPYYEKAISEPHKLDFLQWIIDGASDEACHGKGFHYGRIAYLGESMVGVALCYTQPHNRKAFLSNIAVDRRYRREGIGSKLLRDLIEFYKQRSDIENIELHVGLTNGVAVKFYLDNDFKIIELRDTGYTMWYNLKKSGT
jgi:ribosomal protein S18 acetylase RimI-like enzyme